MTFVDNAAFPSARKNRIGWTRSMSMASIWVFFYFWVAFAEIAGSVVDALTAGSFGLVRDKLLVELPREFVANWHFLYLPLFGLVDHSIEVYRDVRAGALEEKSKAARLMWISLAFAFVAVLFTAAVESVTYKDTIAYLLVAPVTLLTIGMKGATYRVPPASQPVVTRFEPSLLP